MYDRENETLGPASYFATGANRWAVSNVGYFTGSNNPQYTSFSSSQFKNTLNSELFQTARLSASSLRYYGLGLETGKYTVSLEFAETAILDSTTRKSLGRRVFDIYIQVCVISRNCLIILCSEFMWLTFFLACIGKVDKYLVITWDAIKCIVIRIVHSEIKHHVISRNFCKLNPLVFIPTLSVFRAICFQRILIYEKRQVHLSKPFRRSSRFRFQRTT